MKNNLKNDNKKLGIIRKILESVKNFRRSRSNENKKFSRVFEKSLEMR